jgi:hypothetical protein
MLVFLTKYHSIDQIKKNEMSGVCSTYGEMRGLYRVLVGNPEGRRQFERPRQRRGIILKGILETSVGGGTNWIDLSQDRDRWRAVVNAVMNLRVP